MIQTIDISLIPSDNKPVINVSQYDNGLRVLRFNIFDDAEMEVPHEFDGETVTCNIRKNDNNIVVITGTIETETTEETETSYVQVVLTEQACACVGSNYGEISLSNNDDVIGTCNFKLVVERSPLAGGVDSQSEIDNLTTQIENIAEQVIGENYYDKEDIDNKFDDLDIPTKTSQLTNDSGFITASDIPTIPTKTSQLTNDSGFITASDIPTIPTKTSQLTNDSGFINSTDLNNVLADYALWPTDQTTKSAIANFETSFTNPLGFKAYIVAEQEAGTPTPSDPKAITGFSSVTVTQEDGDSQTVETLTIQLGQTVYGGYISQDSAGHRQLVITYSALLDMGDSTWANLSIGDNIFRAVVPNCKFPSDNADRKNGFLCSIYPASSNASISANMTDKSLLRYNGWIVLRDTSYSDYTELASGLSGAKLIYELATPIVIDLPDGEPINTLSGVNNIYCDTGDIEVSYKCTIEEYVNNRLSSTRTLNRAVTLEERSIEENLSETRDIRGYDNEE